MINANNLKIVFSVSIIFVLFCSGILPTTIADTSSSGVKGFDRGVSWRPYVPLKRATFVNFDGETYLDDYAYLAAVPTAVFYDKDSDQIYTNPLLFYQDPYPIKDDKERTLDAYPGIKYFMEDWMGYCNDRLDKMTLINVPKNKLDSTWRANDYTTIAGDDPYDLANKIALNEWSYADNAVIAVIQGTYEKSNDKTYGTITGSLPSKEILTEHFEVPKTNNIYPIYNEFNVPEGYKFLKVRSWYPCFYIKPPAVANMSIPPGDRDIQVYCEKNGQWMMASISEAWNALEGMDKDKTSVYVYNSGKWSVALTDAPTKDIESTSILPQEDTKETEVQKKHSLLGFEFGRYGRIIDILRNMRKVIYQIDVEMYPGVTVNVPETPPFGCRDAYIKLKWNNPSVSLGFSLIGPSDEEVLSTRESGVSSSGLSNTEADMHVHQLGECLPGEHYSICVFSMSEINSAVDFTIEYSWQQNISRMEGDCLASATEGAVLASLLNAPLLYTDPSEVSGATIDVMYKLGVTNLFIVDLGGYVSSKTTEQLSEVTKSNTHFTKYDDIYDYIRKITGKSDVIFSTISPWSYWYTSELKKVTVEIAGEMQGALSIGPAAYIAAQHGSPVLLVENHPELSAAVVWHTEFWRRHPDGMSKVPTVSEMYLTGTRVYNFLKNHDFDKDGEEVIITVGGQFDIGLTWDRVFVGKGMPGRFIDSPTDLSVWISKTVFYPQIVFENPALDSNGVTLINGSSSERRFPWIGKLGLKITKSSEEETFKYPVLETFVCYEHKFNTRASQYWGFTYICADGTIPGVTPSLEPIDSGVMEAVNGQKGGFFPDISASEVQPFYLKRAGYQPVYSTNFEANMYNLNQGVILWLINTHGFSANGGELLFWHETDGGITIPLAAYTKETNPWRGYDWLMGSTEEPDTMTMEVHGILSALLGNPNPKGPRFFALGLDWALSKRPIRDIIGRIFNLPILRLFAPEWLKNTQDYYDGVVIAITLNTMVHTMHNGTQIDDALGNIHSAGVSSTACLPAGKYLHLTLMRHGSVFQIMDPWMTSWYATVWQNSMPRNLALGKTIGEIYSEGISKVGILYISEPPQWWWDQLENVCLYGDPNLRIWVPSNEYSTVNHWESKDVEPLRYDPQDGFSVNGHMPFGVDGYPHEIRKTSITQQLIIFALVIIIITVSVAFYLSRRKRKK